jgi:hypothetical protein
MKRRVLSGLVLLILLVVCIYVPARAGDVLVKNNCGQKVTYSFKNNSTRWITINSGLLGPDSLTESSQTNPSSCVVLVTLEWVEKEIYQSDTASWVKDPDGTKQKKEDCPIEGCIWLQCGSATYKFSPEGAPAKPVKGSTRKCVLTTIK